MAQNQNISIKIRQAFNDFTKISLSFFCVLVILRLIFFLILVCRMDMEWSNFRIIMSGLKFDAILACSVATSTIIPFIAIHYLSAKAARIATNVMIIAYAFLTSLLAEYFCTMSRPLDHVLFAYSADEVANIVLSSTTVSLPTILCIVLTLGAVVGTMLALQKIKTNIIASAVIMLISVYGAFGFKYQKMIREETGYKQHSDFYLAVNQLSYTYIKLSDYLKNDDNKVDGNKVEDNDIAESARHYQALFPETEFPETRYPFWHKVDDNDVLAPFFNKTTDDDLPNIVFIVIESFGQNLTGVKKPSISFTPFIDSLADNGLYWKNCLSTTERTFGVLPAIFASAPQGKVGFANMWHPIPDHNTILKDLSANGYHTSFFYGGCASFDGQDKFLQNSNIDFILNVEPDTTTTERSKTLKEMHRWGIDDRELFDLAIKHKMATDKEPFADIFLTLTTHEPFNFIGIEEYIAQVEKMAKNVTGAERKNIDNNLEIFACFKYIDDCLKHLFNYYKTCPRFENTIFIITGDHRIGFLATKLSLISKYHIPLIIYSPLLKEHKTMNGVVSHLDITPTINSFLSKNYKYNTASYNHWLGTSLDTSANFSCHKRQAFMLNNRDVNDFIADSLFLSNNRLFVVNDNFELTQIENQQLLDSMLENLSKYQTISEYVVNNDYLKKNVNHDNICLMNVDFDNTSLKLFDKETVVIDNNKCLRLDKNVKYGSVCPKTTFDKDIKRIKVEIRFDIQSLDTASALPKLVIEKNGSNPYYFATSINSELNTGKQQTFSYISTINFEGKTKGDIMKIYLWNPSHCTMLYDNLFVKIDEIK